jgi:hypothetical protein
VAASTDYVLPSGNLSGSVGLDRRNTGLNSEGEAQNQFPPPPSRISTSVPRNIGGQPLPGREQFLLVHDVVPIEHGPRFVSGEQHGEATRERPARCRAPAGSGLARAPDRPGPGAA